LVVKFIELKIYLWRLNSMWQNADIRLFRIMNFWIWKWKLYSCTRLAMVPGRLCADGTAEVRVVILISFYLAKKIVSKNKNDFSYHSFL
jgi:hypothetical protein